MKIIGVVDFQKGYIVRAYKGERSKYYPIGKSVEEVTNFYKSFGLQQIYIADLDCIQNIKLENKVERKNFPQIFALSKAFDKVYLDLGIRAYSHLRELIKIFKSNIKWIIPTENMVVETEPDIILLFKKFFSIVKRENIVVSIDLDGDSIISESFLKNWSIYDTIIFFKKIGIVNFIILNLRKVGTMEGISNNLLELLGKLSEKHGLNIFIGGGINSAKEIQKIASHKIKGVLISTAFYLGTIKKEDLSKLLPNYLE